MKNSKHLLMVISSKNVIFSMSSLRFKDAVKCVDFPQVESYKNHNGHIKKVRHPLLTTRAV